MTATIAEAYPELFHYTDIVGLKGIIESQTLWATHAAFLNDVTETRLFIKERLPAILNPTIAQCTANLARAPANQSLIAQHGGKKKITQRKSITTEITTGIFNALFGNQTTPPYVEPFVTSFCGAATARIAEHGLLSQWRGYTKNGGYAITFNTAKLYTLLRKEAEKWPGNTLILNDAIYSNDVKKLRFKLGTQIKEIKTSITQWLQVPPNPQSLENLYIPLIQCAYRFKHWGFREENEVRIISVLPGKELAEAHRAHAPGVTMKPRWNFIRAGMAVPCIHLFEGITRLPDKPLPITRIIVGPHQNKDERRRAVESLLGQHRLNIQVSVSEIPYVDH